MYTVQKSDFRFERTTLARVSDHRFIMGILAGGQAFHSIHRDNPTHFRVVFWPEININRDYVCITCITYITIHNVHALEFHGEHPNIYNILSTDHHS